MQSPPHKPGYYSFSQPMPSDPASSVLPSLHALLSSAPPICPSSDYTPRQSDANAHSTSRQAPIPDIIPSDVPANMTFSTFHTFQSDTLSLPEELKMQDQMAWVGRMNNIRACAEEIALNKIV